jgi:hypothetical protein
MKSSECDKYDEVFTFRADSGETYHWNATKIADAFEAGRLEPVCHMYLDITEADYLHVCLNNGIEEDHLLTITPERLRLPVFFAEFPAAEGEEHPSHVLFDGNHRLVQTYRKGGRRIAAVIFAVGDLTPYLVEDLPEALAQYVIDKAKAS